MATTQAEAGSAKRQAIVRAAADAFLLGGYEGTNVDHIAASAGVSKQTIYNHFGDKESLFRTICAELTAELMAPLQAASGQDLRATLVALGHSCLDVSLRPSSLDLHRLIISAAKRFPELGPEIYAAGAQRMLSELAGLIERAAREGQITVGDPRTAAEQFYGMLTGFEHFRALMGIAGEHGSQDGYVRSCVDAFLAAYGKREGQTV